MSTSGMTTATNEIPLPLPPRIDKMASSAELSTRSSKRHSSKSLAKAERLGRFTVELSQIMQQKDNEIQALKQALFLEKISKEDAQADVQEMVKRFKIVHEQKRKAVEEAERVKRELSGFIDGLARAKREIKSCQETIRMLEQQRNIAEAEAREARNLAFEMREEREVVVAREEGWRQGIVEGLTRARSLDTQTIIYETTDNTNPTTDEDEIYEETADTRNSPEPAPLPMPVPQPSPQPSHYSAPPQPPAIPEGFISQVEPDMSIPVPPPHALSNPPPIPGASPLGIIHEDSRESPLRVPPPVSHHRGRSRRDSSTSSASISQFEILSNHSHHAGPSSVQATPQQYAMHTQTQQQYPMPTPVTMPKPATTPQPELRHYSSRTTLNMPLNSREAGFDAYSPAGTRKTIAENETSSDSSDSEESNSNSNGYTVTVQGPSRSPSGSPPEMPADGTSHLLSAEDAMRVPDPIPLSPQQPPPIPISQLPRGFVASTFTPAPTAGPLPSVPGGPVIPSDEVRREAEEESTTSSGMSSDSGLTTPVRKGKSIKRSKEDLTNRFDEYLSGSSPVLPPPPPVPVVAPPTRGRGKGKRGRR